MAYKKDIDDVRESAALKVAAELLRHGATVSYHDPHVASVKVGETQLHSAELTAEMLAEQDLAIVMTAHAAVDYAAVVRGSAAVFDTRNATGGIPGENMTRLGVG